MRVNQIATMRADGTVATRTHASRRIWPSGCFYNPMETFGYVKMRMQSVAIVMACLMTVASVAGIAARPTAKVGSNGIKFVLEDAIPRQFGDWHERADRGAQVVNPETKELIDRIYSQTLTRTYVNSQGYAVMLSLAYGDDQRGALAAHKPEVCYPAQGFVVRSNVAAQLPTPFGSIPVHRLDTAMGARNEPVTYWFAVGESAITSKWQQRFEEFKLGLTGQIPDGLLFRVSSIDPDPVHAFPLQDRFVSDLLRVVASKDRPRLSGLAAPA